MGGLLEATTSVFVGVGDCVADAVALRETLALVVALVVGDGEPVFVGEPVDEGVADSDGVPLAESDVVKAIDAPERAVAT